MNAQGNITIPQAVLFEYRSSRGKFRDHRKKSIQIHFCHSSKCNLLPTKMAGSCQTPMLSDINVITVFCILGGTWPVMEIIQISEDYYDNECKKFKYDMKT